MNFFLVGVNLLVIPGQVDHWLHSLWPYLSNVAICPDVAFGMLTAMENFLLLESVLGRWYDTLGLITLKFRKKMLIYEISQKEGFYV